MSFCTLTLRIFVFARRSTPSQTSLTESSGLATITRITLEIELFTALNCFAGAGSSISIRVSGGGKLIHYLSQLYHYSTTFT